MFATTDSENPALAELLEQFQKIQEKIRDLENEKQRVVPGEKEFNFKQIDEQLAQHYVEKALIQKKLPSFVEPPDAHEPISTDSQYTHSTDKDSEEIKGEESSYKSHPTEVKLHIFSFLDQNTLKTLLNTNKDTRLLAADETLWQRFKMGNFIKQKQLIFAITVKDTETVKNMLERTQDPKKLYDLLDGGIIIKGQRIICYDLAMHLAIRGKNDEIVRLLLLARLLLFKEDSKKWENTDRGLVERVNFRKTIIDSFQQLLANYNEENKAQLANVIQHEIDNPENKKVWLNDFSCDHILWLLQEGIITIEQILSNEPDQTDFYNEYIKAWLNRTIFLDSVQSFQLLMQAGLMAIKGNPFQGKLALLGMKIIQEESLSKLYNEDFLIFREFIKYYHFASEEQGTTVFIQLCRHSLPFVKCIGNEITSHFSLETIFAGIEAALEYCKKYPNEDNLDYIKFLYGVLYENNSIETIKGQIPNFDERQMNFLSSAITSNFYQFVVYLVESQDVKCTEKNLLDAIKTGNLQLVQYVYQTLQQRKVNINGSEIISHIYYDAPDIEIVKWLIFEKNMFNPHILQVRAYPFLSSQRHIFIILSNKDLLNLIEQLKDTLVKAISAINVPREEFDTALATQKELTTKLINVTKFQQLIMENPVRSIMTLINELERSEESDLIRKVFSPDLRSFPTLKEDIEAELNSAMKKLTEKVIGYIKKESDYLGGKMIEKYFTSFLQPRTGPKFK